MKRRNGRKALMVLAAGAGAGAAFAASSGRSRLGLVTYALALHRRYDWDGRHGGLSPALALLEESRLLGAGGIQVGFVEQDIPYLDEVRERAERYGLHVEAILAPPEDEADVDRFEGDVRRAQRGGARLARTVVIPGRRYEQFRSLTEFRDFEQRGERALERAEPVLRRHRFRLAVENHKDQRTWEKLAMLERLSSEFLGVCVDVGNNFPLMEDPLEYVREFAPWAFSVHLKDQAVREMPGGYWLADVALGEGFLDLPTLVRVLREAKPEIRFNFETITRDAIPVPMLTEEFWATMADTSAAALARVLRVLKTQAHTEPFPRVSELSRAEQLALERRNLERSLEYAASVLGL